MAGGLPHRMRFKAFSARYRLLVVATTGEEERLPADCRLILAAFERRRLALALDAGAFANSAASVSAVLGKKHIFLSESARQQLELVRTERRMTAAAIIQTAWRAWRERRNQPQQWSQKFAHQQQQQNHHLHFNSLTKKYPGSPNGLAAPSPANVFNVHRPARPQPITGTPPPPQHQIHSHIYHQLQQSQLSAEAPPPPPPSSLQFSPPSEALKSSVVPPLTSNSAAVELCDFNMVRETCALFGIDLHTPPPLPPARPYSILTSATGTFKCHFPQLRTMRADYVDPSSKRLLLAKNQQVVVLGNAAGGRRGLLVVQHPQTSSSAKAVPERLAATTAAYFFYTAKW
ncbi:Myosin [Tyrophagus putrescentiae]|nr:Myosin [Tyrophagus putrescentiae]